MKQYFLKDGNVKEGINLILFITAILGVVVSMTDIFSLCVNNIIFSIALVFGCFSAGVSRARTFKLKPFTNDPLGWRKARKSSEEREEFEKSGSVVSEKHRKEEK